MDLKRRDFLSATTAAVTLAAGRPVSRANDAHSGCCRCFPVGAHCGAICL